MEFWLDKLLSDYPCFGLDAVRVFGVVATNGPNVPVSHLIDHLKWSKSRAAKALAELSGCSDNKKSRWFQKNNAEAPLPILIKESIDPADLRVKLLSLTHIGKTYSPLWECPNIFPGNAVMLAEAIQKIKEKGRGARNDFGSLRDKNIIPASKIEEHRVFELNLQTISILLLKYLEIKAQDIPLINKKCIDVVLSFINFDSLTVDAESSNRYAIKIISFLKNNFSKDLENNYAKALGFASANIRYSLLKKEKGDKTHTKTGSRTFIDKHANIAGKDLKLSEFVFQSLRSKASSCFKVYQLFKNNLGSEAYVFDVAATMGVDWCRLLDRIACLGGQSIADKTSDELIGLAKNSDALNTLVPGHVAEISSLLNDYILSTANLQFSHEVAQKFIENSRYFIGNPPLEPHLSPTLDILSNPGHSIFINQGSKRESHWLCRVIQQAISNKQLPIVVGASGQIESNSALRGYSTKEIEPRDILTTDFVPEAGIYTSSKGVLEFLTNIKGALENNQFEGVLFIELGGGYIHLKDIYSHAIDNLPFSVHTHYVFRSCPTPINPLGPVKSNHESVDLHSLFWSKALGLAVGDISEDDYELLYSWCLSGVEDKYPLEIKSVSKMPPHRYIDFNVNQWQPNNII